MPLPLEKVQAVQTIVTHGNCPDGLASAIILSDALPHARVLFLQHNTPELDRLVPTEGMLFCDFCPPQARLPDFQAVGTLVLDHHAKQKEQVTSFEHHVFADEVLEPGVCGAVLAFRHVWDPLHRNEDVPTYGSPSRSSLERFAYLAGVRDTWQRNSPDWEEACAQAEMLRFYPESYWLSQEGLEVVKDANRLRSHMDVGRLSLIKFSETVRRVTQQSWFFTSPKGTRVAVFQDTRYTSDASDLLTGVDLVIGFSYLVEEGVQKMILSTRTRGAYDCGAFCKAHGGGGHTKAAGFTMLVQEGDPNPYERVKAIVQSYEART